MRQIAFARPKRALPTGRVARSNRADFSSCGPNKISSSKHCVAVERGGK